jgi:hypothetical protein
LTKEQLGGDGIAKLPFEFCTHWLQISQFILFDAWESNFFAPTRFHTVANLV